MRREISSADTEIDELACESYGLAESWLHAIQITIAVRAPRWNAALDEAAKIGRLLETF